MWLELVNVAGRPVSYVFDYIKRGMAESIVIKFCQNGLLLYI